MPAYAADRQSQLPEAGVGAPAQIVTDEYWNGMDCTTYMLSDFGLDINVLGLYADEIVDQLPVLDIGQEGIGNTAAVQAFFSTHLVDPAVLTRGRVGGNR